MAVEVLNPEDEHDFQEWESLVESSGECDVYYRPGYAYAYQVAGHGKAIGLILSTARTQVLLPLLLRSLSDLSFPAPAGATDAVTPYGYGGILLLSPPQTIAGDALRAIFAELRSWCIQTGVVSCLLRLHPVFSQQQRFDSIVDGQNIAIRHHGSTIAINLNNWDEGANRAGDFTPSRRGDLNVARRHLTITCSSPAGNSEHDFNRHLSIFQEVYASTMQRLGANSFYNLIPSYYTALAWGLGDKMAVLIAWLREEPVGTAIFFADRTMGHYHLSGSSEAGREHRAATLIVNEGARWARSRGCALAHLGGGVVAHDPLYKFKRSCGGSQFEYSLINFIAAPDLYHELVKLRLTALPQPLQMNFFPEYRA